MFSLDKVDTFPELTRSGRVSEELNSIIDALLESANTGARFAISGVIPGKPYNSMQQRIRAQAKKHNLKVIIRFDADDMKLYFKASHGPKEKVSVESMETTEVVAQEKTEVKASEIKGVKTKATQSTSK